MKKLLFSIIALLSVTILAAQKPIVIKGKIDNCPNRQNSFIEKQWFNPERLEEETKRTNFSIAEDGTFYVKIPNADEFYTRYWIHLGNEKKHLDLMAGDSIYMTLDAAKFDESIKYKGRGAGRNTYLNNIFLEFWDPISPTKINLNDPSQILDEVNRLTSKELEVLNKYHLSGEIDSSYYQFEKGMIINGNANLVLSTKNRFRNPDAFSDSDSRQIDLMIKAANFKDDQFMQRPEFRDLVLWLPGYMTQHNSIVRQADLNREIKFAAAHYTNAMQLYFNKHNIRKYLSQAPNVSQKNALLNYFDKQFDAPVLKNVIQQQRNQLHSNRIGSSMIFKAAVISITLLIVMVFLLFAIVKLIQQSGKKKMKFNWSLLLKIVFYLGVAILAMGFMAHNNKPFNGLSLVLLMLGTFLVHTYVLIPKYALNGKISQYILFTGSALLIFVVGCLITDQVQASMYALLVLNEVFFGLVLFSWLSYYIHQLASGKSTFKELIKKNDLNLEIAFNLVAVLLINLMFIAGVDHTGLLNPSLLFYTILLLFYFHIFISYPRFFNKEKAIQFIGINVLVLLGASAMMIALDALQSHRALQTIGVSTKLSELINGRNIRPDLLLVFSLLLIPSFIYYYIKKQLTAIESTGFQLYRKKEAELAQLKSQVNPHFLFNTLNTLYAFALKEGSDKTAECIAKLANLMRFMLDDMEKETILLKREISYIHDYVKLQSIRSAVEHDIAINVDMQDGESYSIAPMLLIPFVENAFKHGMNPNKVSQLKIDIRAKDNQIQFVIENSIDENFQAYYKEKGFGIGIENVKSRLRHVYPDKHTLSIAKTSASFIVIMNIEV
ncbi:MAG TPA: histidine kinase [Prolixibacteraceae bacterium]|nr:histidine kinase [Prolixibacteraceae bacterium]